MFAFHLKYLAERLFQKSTMYSQSMHHDGVLGVYDFESGIMPTGSEGLEEYVKVARAHFDKLEADTLIIADTSLHGVESGLAILGMDIHDLHVVSVADMREWHVFLQRWAMAGVFMYANVWGVDKILLFTTWALMVLLGHAPPTKDEVLGFYTHMHKYTCVVVVGQWVWSWGSGDTIHVEVSDGGLFRDSDKVEEVNDLMNIVTHD